MDTTEERLNKMAQWAKGTEASLARLNAALTTSDVALADTVAAELGALYEQYSDTNATLREATEAAGMLGLQNSDVKEQMSDIEAEAFLDVSALLTEAGKEKYSNDTKREAAVRLQLRDDVAYQKLRTDRREINSELIGIKALVGDIERSLKEYGRRNLSLVARLDNLTARIQ